jgi:hypothetical protein
MLLQQKILKKETPKTFKPSINSTISLNHNDQYNLLQFFSLLIEIDQRNYFNTGHISPSQKGGETNEI